MFGFKVKLFLHHILSIVTGGDGDPAGEAVLAEHSLCAGTVLAGEKGGPA